MTRRLPPLQGLRAFEVAGRTFSFAKAGDELCVTPSAISQQVRSLEQQLGRRLFKRLASGLALTDEGRYLLPFVRQAFDLLSEGVLSLSQRDIPKRLTMAVLSSFATKWLMPRLREFRETCPNIELCIFPSPVPPDFAASDCDLAILWGLGAWPGCVSQLLAEELVFPVCAPVLLERDPRLRQTADLAHQVILRTPTHDLWPTWLEAGGLRGLKGQMELIFDDASMMIDAAIDGQGVALARSALALDALVTGRLVKPFDLVLRSPYSYYVVFSENEPKTEKTAQFVSWLAKVASRDKFIGAPSGG